MKNRSNEIRSNEIRIRQELPVVTCVSTRDYTVFYIFRGEAFREKSDVWSFGVFMWEMFHLGSAEPYGDKKDMIDVKRLVINYQSSNELKFC